MELQEVVSVIYQFGALPLLLIMVWYMFKRIKELNEIIIKKNKEIRQIEKENVGLLYKCLAALKKINKKNNEK